MVFPPIWGKNGGVLNMHMQVILDSSFARPGSAPIRAGRKKSSGTGLEHDRLMADAKYKKYRGRKKTVLLVLGLKNGSA